MSTGIVWHRQTYFLEKKNGLVVARSGSEEMMDNHLLTDMKFFSERKEMLLNKILVLIVQFYKYARTTEM